MYEREGIRSYEVSFHGDPLKLKTTSKTFSKSKFIVGHSGARHLTLGLPLVNCPDSERKRIRSFMMSLRDRGEYIRRHRYENL